MGVAALVDQENLSVYALGRLHAGPLVWMAGQTLRMQRHGAERQSQQRAESQPRNGAHDIFQIVGHGTLP